MLTTFFSTSGSLPIAQLCRRPLPVGFIPIRRTFWRYCMKPTGTPSSISALFCFWFAGGCRYPSPRRTLSICRAGETTRLEVVEAFLPSRALLEECARRKAATLTTS